MPDSDSKRRIGTWAAASLVVSNMVGAGIFTTSGFLLENLHSPLLMLGVWALGGALAMAGAASYAELGASLPNVGGDYIFLRKAYGPMFAFLTGWMSFFVGFGAPIALTALGFVEYLTPVAPALTTQGHQPVAQFMGFSPTVSPGHLAAIAVIWILTYIHYLGIRVSGRVQLSVTVLNLLLIVSLLLTALIFGKAGDWSHFYGSVSIPDRPGASMTAMSLSGMAPAVAVSLVMVLYGYTGFNAAAYVAGEIKNPGKKLPLAIIAGTGLVVALYLALNAVYIYALPADKISGRIDVARLAATALTGGRAGALFSLVIAFCVLACCSAMVCIAPRIYFAMASDRLFPSFAARLSPKHGTPGYALLFQAVWASMLVILGTFSQLLTYCGFMLGLFTSLTIAAVFVLRRRAPELKRPYRVWGYPLTPALYLAICILMMGYVLFEKPGESLAGICIVSLG
ncbi:MAG: APC family permease, partial [Gemmatimonadota bacterium]|nr:APC family permease [Gemmatimonadota bacterium]